MGGRFAHELTQTIEAVGCGRDPQEEAGPRIPIRAIASFFKVALRAVKLTLKVCYGGIEARS
jgi:hypothetical protein